MTFKRHRRIQGVLCNFLGTYTSRYSNYDGWWLFGFLADEIQQLTIDLLNPQITNSENRPLILAAQLAGRKFREQMDKNRIAISLIREARLEISKLPQSKDGFANGRASVGNEFRFAVQTTTDFGKTYKTEATIFIAPHNPKIESRSTRAHQIQLQP